MKTTQESYAIEHFADLLKQVEQGETIEVLRKGRALAKVVPAEPQFDSFRAAEAVKRLGNFQRGTLPEGVTVRDLLEEGRRY